MSFSHKPTVRKKPMPAKNARAAFAQKSVLDLADEDSIEQVLTEEELKRHEEQQNRRAFSYLSADAVRWMQKRKPAASSSAKNFIPPARVLQLRAIFRGLDFDGSGEIDLEELKEAVNYVANSDSGTGPAVFGDPDAIVKIFEDMDIDKNGTVDFDEFLVGMTSDAAGGKGGGMSGARMQNAFFDFANKHRRQTIVDKINDEKLNSSERYKELGKLYKMKYLKDEPKDCTVDEMISKMKQEALQQKKEMNVAAEKYRRAEINRARAAHLYFDTENPGKGRPTFASSRSIKGRNSVTAALGHLTGDPCDDSHLLIKANKTVRRNMCAFSLDIGDTYTPDLTTQMSASDLTRRVHDSAYAVKNAASSRKDLLLPPESQSKALLTRVETQKKLHFTITEKVEKKKEYSGLARANMRKHESGAAMFGGRSMSVIARRQSVMTPGSVSANNGSLRK